MFLSYRIFINLLKNLELPSSYLTSLFHDSLCRQSTSWLHCFYSNVYKSTGLALETALTGCLGSIFDLMSVKKMHTAG